MIEKVAQCENLINTMASTPLKGTIQSAQSILEANNRLIKRKRSFYGSTIIRLLTNNSMLNICICIELSDDSSEISQEEKAMLIDELNTNLSRVIHAICLIYFFQ